MAHPAPAVPDPSGRYTVAQYVDLARRGVLGANDRVELLEGVIVTMSPQNPPHAAGVQMATLALVRAVGDRAVVRCQLPLVAGALSLPEPDVAVVAGRPTDFADRHPDSALLVLEVADASLVADRLTKGPLYARAGVSEYWIANLADERVEVHRDPDGGCYRTTLTAHRGECLTLAALPAVVVAVADLLPHPAR